MSGRCGHRRTGAFNLQRLVKPSPDGKVGVQASEDLGIEGRGKIRSYPQETKEGLGVEQGFELRLGKWEFLEVEAAVVVLVE
ncbi:hypothetical protein L7F22_049118, partial [Adiantum nelumboides]|nr:hypothetical protein [Adiantum nelumboides]